MSKVAAVKFVDYQTSVAKTLDLVGAADKLPNSGLIIIKPNLTNSDRPPVTTPVVAAEANEEQIKQKALGLQKVIIAMGGKAAKKVIAIKSLLVNIVV